MRRKNIAVFGIYRNREAVEEGMNALRKGGFRNTDISVLLAENMGTKDFAHEKHSKAPEGAATGAAIGVVIGGTLGWLVGAGTLAIPGLGPFIVAGPIVALLAGVGAMGTIGGIAGALIGMAIPEYEARRYEGRIRNGGILLSVHCDDSYWRDRAEDILKKTGAEESGSESEAKAAYAVSEKPGSRAA